MGELVRSYGHFSNVLKALKMSEAALSLFDNIKLHRHIVSYLK